jgi:hypothetical protein
MSDVYAKLGWAKKHIEDLTKLGEDYLRLGGGDERPLGITWDNRNPPMVEPMPVEISLHAGDCIHNARTALDHIVARLKEHLGGDPGKGGFPITQSDSDWKGRVYPRRKGKRVSGPLDGLPCAARSLIYREQPHVRYTDRTRDDPLVTLSTMDNADKHQLLWHGFAYPTVERGLDLIRIKNRKRVLREENAWTTGQPLEHDTVMARFVVRGNAKEVLAVDERAEVKLSTGPLGAPRTTYEEMITRVREIADKAASLIDLQS